MTPKKRKMTKRSVQLECCIFVFVCECVCDYYVLASGWLVLPVVHMHMYCIALHCLPVPMHIMHTFFLFALLSHQLLTARASSSSL